MDYFNCELVSGIFMEYAIINDLCTEELDLHKTTVLENSCEHSILYI